MEAPEVPLEQAHEEMQHHAHHSGEKWISGVALSAAILAAVAAVTAMMAGHCVNEAVLEQIKASNKWSYFQSKSIKESFLKNKVELLKADNKPVSDKDTAKLKEYEDDKGKIQKEASELEAESEVHMKQHVTFSKALTLLQVAIALAAVSALSKTKPLWFVSLVFGAIGIGFFAMGFKAPDHGHEHKAEANAAGHGDKPAEGHAEKPAEKPVEGEKKAEH